MATPQWNMARKQYLIDKGLLDEFKKARSQLRAEGITGFIANKLLNEQFDVTTESLSDYLNANSKEDNSDAGSDRSPDLREVQNKTGPQDVKNVVWAGENMANATVKRDEAPTETAWGLLMWARKNPDAFYAQLYRHVVLPTRKEVEQAADASQDAERIEFVLKRVRDSAMLSRKRHKPDE